MNNPDRRFWPFRPRTSIVATMLILVGLTLVFALLRITVKWPSQKSDTALLIGISLFGLLPIFLALVDVIIERGGVIEYRGAKIDFSQAPKMEATGFTVPANIGEPGQALMFSATTMILDVLKQTLASDVVIINLKDGRAWWETRLLILLAGAVRRRKPGKVVFVGMDGKIDRRFQGWGYSSDLLPRLLQAHPQYPLSYHAALAAARQWDLVEPSGPGAIPPKPGWIQPGLATKHSWMAYDGATGLPNELLAEQMLASELGEKVESVEQPKWISLVRLEELFRPVLHQGQIDESWSAKRQLSAFFDHDSECIAFTQNGRYKALVSRLSLLSEIVKTWAEKRQ